MSVYDIKPEQFLGLLHEADPPSPAAKIYCAGFELGVWRCEKFALHLAEWLPEYALPEQELIDITHANIVLKLTQAAVRVYTSKSYEKRGEAGEIALHAICRQFFDTIPISPRVFYKSASNDVVKAFDLVHVRFPTEATMEIWLGESKLYQDGAAAIGDAIASVKAHLEAGFLNNQKALLGPQIPRSIPRYDDVMAIFKQQASLDGLLNAATFVVGILCDSEAAAKAKATDEAYIAAAKAELEDLTAKLETSGLTTQLRMVLVYIPLASKKALVAAFDERLKGLQQ